MDSTKNEETEEIQLENLVIYLDVKPALEYLSSYGFTNVKLCLKFLHKFKYNQEKALMKLQKKGTKGCLKEIQ